MNITLNNMHMHFIKIGIIVLVLYKFFKLLNLHLYLDSKNQNEYISYLLEFLGIIIMIVYFYCIGNYGFNNDSIFLIFLISMFNLIPTPDYVGGLSIIFLLIFRHFFKIRFS